MKSISRLFTAFATLASSLVSLASLVDITSGKLRQSLALDAAEPPALALPGPVIENAAPGSETGPEEDASPSTSTRRRAKAS